MLVATALLLASGAAAQSQSRVVTDATAADVLGGLDTHARAISCTNGGWFSSVKYAEDSGRISSLELCCTNAGDTSVIWYEGGGVQLKEPCFTLGVPDNSVSGVCFFAVTERAWRTSACSEALHAVHLTRACSSASCRLRHVDVVSAFAMRCADDLQYARERPGTVVNANAPVPRSATHTGDSHCSLRVPGDMISALQAATARQRLRYPRLHSRRSRTMARSHKRHGRSSAAQRRAPAGSRPCRSGVATIKLAARRESCPLQKARSAGRAARARSYRPCTQCGTRWACRPSPAWLADVRFPLHFLAAESFDIARVACPRKCTSENLANHTTQRDQPASQPATTARCASSSTIRGVACVGALNKSCRKLSKPQRI